jgi:hypothetical protein
MRGLESWTNEHLEVSMNFHEIVKAIHIGPYLRQQGYSGPVDLDIAIGKCQQCVSDSYLTIKEPDKLTLYDEIAMCGYPGTWQSMLYENQLYAGIRLGPVTQFGRIVGLMPLNESPLPYVMQTDIVSTVGSSGSPIVNRNDGQVVAIAQAALWCHTPVVPYNLMKDYLQETIDYKLVQHGFSEIGILYGITNHILSKLPESGINYLEYGTSVEIDFEVSSLKSNPKTLIEEVKVKSANPNVMKVLW